MDDILKKIDTISDEEVWEFFALSKLELKKRGLVRTNNITGERGEFLAIEAYKNNPKVSNLQAAPEGTQNVDALSRKGERYSIKAITEPGKTTSVFYGCGNPEDPVEPDKKFEYVIIVLLDRNLKLSKILEIDWRGFLKFRKWHKTMRGWNISVTQQLLNEAKVVV